MKHNPKHNSKPKSRRKPSLKVKYWILDRILYGLNGKKRGEKKS